MIFIIHQPPLPSQLQDPRICNIASSSNISENFKFSKLFAISLIWGPCDRKFEDPAMIAKRMGECVDGWVTKIATKKNKPTFLIFLATIFVTQFPPITIAVPRMRLHQTILRIWIRNIASSSNNFKNFKFSKLFAISLIRGPCDCKFEDPAMIAKGRGECVDCWVTKIATEKIKPTFLIFLAAIFVTQCPSITIAVPSNASSSNSFKNLNSQYCVFIK